MPYSRIEAALFDSPWAVMPSKLEAMCEVVSRRLANDKSIPEGFLPSTGPEPVTLYNGVHVIPVRGVMGKRMNLFSMISGGVSTEQVGAQFQEALADPNVTGILLDIDSPGGLVDGAFALADLVYGSRGVKPIVAFADGCAASAAYLLASAADRIIANQTADVGSIGIVAMHTDCSGADAQRGVKREFLTAGRYKASDRDNAPLDSDGRAMIQGQLDQLYSLFVDKVARNRGVATSVVLEDMADGRIFIGASALSQKLVDEIGERGAAINAVLSASHSSTYFTLRGASADSTGPRGKGTETMKTFMESLRLVLDGKSAEVDEKDRGNVEAVVGVCRERFEAEAQAKAAADAKAAAEAQAAGAAGAAPAAPVAVSAPTASTPEAASVEAIQLAERGRCESIRALCRTLGQSDSYAKGLIDKGVSVEAAVRAATTEAEGRQGALAVNHDAPEKPASGGSGEASQRAHIARAEAHQRERGGTIADALKATAKA